MTSGCYCNTLDLVNIHVYSSRWYNPGSQKLGCWVNCKKTWRNHLTIPLEIYSLKTNSTKTKQWIFTNLMSATWSQQAGTGAPFSSFFPVTISSISTRHVCLRVRPMSGYHDTDQRPSPFCFLCSNAGSIAAIPISNSQPFIFFGISQGLSVSLCKCITSPLCARCAYRLSRVQLSDVSERQSLSSSLRQYWYLPSCRSTG